MKRYTYIQSNYILAKTDFPKPLNRCQRLRVNWWIIFNHKKFFAFLEGIERGYPILTSYHVAKIYYKIIKK